VITIGASDVGPAPASRTSRTPLRITEEDLRPVPPLSTNSANMTELETLMFGLVNSAREASLPRWLGQPSLRWHEGLAAVARGHSADMLKRQYVSHETPEGVKVAQRIERCGVRYLACGENIGIVYGPASHSEEGIYEIHKAFMNQPRRLTNHRGNLLNPIWSHVGIGTAYDESGSLIVTQNFVALLRTS
jgi:uncharacterized protein YkwD